MKKNMHKEKKKHKKKQQKEKTGRNFVCAYRSFAYFGIWIW